MRGDSKLAAFAALAGGVVAIGWSAIFVRWTQIPGTASAFYRMLIASAVLWLLLARRKATLPRMSLRTLALSSLGGAFFAADVGLYNVAVLRTSAGNATFLGNNAPLIVGLLTWLITRRLPSWRFWVALVIALAGAALIVSIDFSHVASRSTADLMAVLASACFAIYMLITERVRDKLDTMTLVTLSTTASAIALLAFTVGAHVSLAVPGVASLGALIGLGLLCQLAGYFCLTYALGHLPATISSIVMLAVAPLTALLAFVFFEERMSPLQLLGGALILAAVWIVSRGAGLERSVLPQGCELGAEPMELPTE